MDEQKVIDILQELERTSKNMAHGNVRNIAHGELNETDAQFLRCGAIALMGLAGDLLKELK